jgi:hypothetical protein
MRRARFDVPLLAALATAMVSGCVPPRAVYPDSGVTAIDAGEPIVFSIGVSDSASVSHQVAPYLNLVFDQGSPSADTVLARRVSTPPVLDGVDTDWAAIAGSTVPLEAAGASLGMTVDEWDTGYGLLSDGGLRPWDFGMDQALVKAAYDDDTLYFLVQWTDSTASVGRNFLTFANGTWSRSAEDEDHLYFSFNVSFPDFAGLGCTAACHLRERLGDTSDAGVAWRTLMHTNETSQVVDVWNWASVATNPMAHADDLSFQSARRVNDDALGFSTSNRVTLSDGGLEPKYMSEFGVNDNPAALYAPDSGLHPMAVPYSAAGLDAGARVPGVVHQLAGGSRADVRAVGKWRNGKWTVELARARVTSDVNDAKF